MENKICQSPFLRKGGVNTPGPKCCRGDLSSTIILGYLPLEMWNEYILGSYHIELGSKIILVSIYARWLHIPEKELKLDMKDGNFSIFVAIVFKGKSRRLEASKWLIVLKPTE